MIDTLAYILISLLISALRHEQPYTAYLFSIVILRT